MKTFLLMSGFASVAAAQPALTIYNEDFAVVRDRVNLDLAEGSHELTYSGATALLEPESVILRDPTGQMVFRILEQSYRNDPADQALLLKLFEGKEIDFEVPVGEGKTVVQRGKIVRAGDPQPIIEMDGKLRFDLPGQPLFDSLGDNTILQPTLSWQLQAPAAVKGEAELAYLTGGLSWSADYNLVLPEQGETFDWVGWVSVNNHCGKTFEEANIKLLAGDVARVAPPQRMPRAGREMYAMAAPMVEAEVTEKAFDDFHLYTLPRAVTLMDRETKQVEFTRAEQVEANRFYVYDGSGFDPFSGVLPMFGEGEYGGGGNKKVASYVEFKNSEENHLGIPLPKGRVRFYREDGDQLQFVGEAQIDHTAKDETLRLKTGHAFDLVGERRRMNFTKSPRRDEATETFEIKLRNRKETAVEIRVVEHLLRWANWEITEATLEPNKLNAQTLEFRVPLAAGEEKTLTYTVQYTW